MPNTFYGGDPHQRNGGVVRAVRQAKQRSELSLGSSIFRISDPDFVKTIFLLLKMFLGAAGIGIWTTIRFYS